MNPLTIGEIKSLLKTMRQDADVEFDFCHFPPTGVGSYRGYYNQPNLRFDSNCKHKTIKVSDLLDMLDDLTSREFTGWKGGDYRYTDSDILHVAEDGCTSCTYIWDVEQIGKDWPVVVLKTMYQ